MCWRSSLGHQSAGGEDTWAAARPTDKCKLPRVTECPRVLMAQGGPFPSGELQLPSRSLELTLEPRQEGHDQPVATASFLRFCNGSRDLRRDGLAPGTWE